MAKKIKFVRDVYLDGAKAHAIGDELDATPGNERHVRRGNAVEVDVEESKDKKDKKDKKGKK